jgi:predicted small secreted protein
MEDFMRKYISVISVLLLVVLLAGCGGTVSGMVKDTRRIGSGVRKVFVSE